MGELCPLHPAYTELGVGSEEARALGNVTVSPESVQWLPLHISWLELGLCVPGM